MKIFITLFLVLCSASSVRAQYKVRFIVTDNNLPGHEGIYITGDFNNWNPGETKYKLTQLDATHKSILLVMPAGRCEYKFTRGDWASIEKDNFCNEMENRRTEIRRDTTIKISINFWMDQCNTVHLKKTVRSQREDTTKVYTWAILSSLETDSIIALGYANNALYLSQKLQYAKGKATAYSLKGNIYDKLGKYAEARKFHLAALEVSEKLQDKSAVAGSYYLIAQSFFSEKNTPAGLQNTYSAIKFYELSGDKLGMANCYSNIGDHEAEENNNLEGLKNYRVALKLYEEVGAGNGTVGVGVTYDKIGRIWLKQGNYSEALRNDSLALKIYKELNFKSSAADVLLSIGNVYQKQAELSLAVGQKQSGQNKLGEALKKFKEALKIHEGEGTYNGIANSYVHLGSINLKMNNLVEARSYLDKALDFWAPKQNTSSLLSIYYVLAKLDSTEGDYYNAYENYKLYMRYRDILNNQEDAKKNVQIKMQFLFDKKETIAKADQEKKDAEARRIKNQQYYAIAGLTIVIIAVVALVLIQFRNNKLKQKANFLLQRQKEKAESTLSELKITQAQLIQSEKMASLGELTAGIAHEIQNPLNFVNNFSEVNAELIEELKSEKAKPKSERDAQVEEGLLNDIVSNLEKINHHGKRADAIVKGMLQHSRTSSGKKEPTDINALADEYLRLAYHGLRAKDKLFNVLFKTDYDESLGIIDVIPQDMGRVILNLITNAFYAASLAPPQIIGLNPAGVRNPQIKHEPTVWVITKKKGDNALISVRDNGPGIPKKILDKIFQPFFTTKPTGQGTGLGLSLSYDIVKAHGGELNVETKEGEGTEFVIMLPL